jgi:hypothetical protein
VNATNLKAATVYYAIAYAKNSVNVGYGDPINFPTNDSKPVLGKITQSSPTSNSIVVNGIIEKTFELPITAKGFIWSRFNTLDINSYNNTGSQNLGIGSSSFSHTIPNLEPGTLYYVKSYATSASGTGYSDLSSFTTLSTTPSITTNSVASVNSSNATLRALITSDGGETITSAGFVVSTSRNQIANSTNQFTVQNPSIGDISLTRPGLSRGTYYFRAFVVNKNGRVEGLEYSFVIP